MVCDREDADLITNDGVDHTKRETLRNETAFPMPPLCAKAWVLQKKLNRALKLGEEGLR